MEIQETLIKDSEIVGISPLMRTQYPDQTIFTLYKRFQWSFDVILKQQIVTIKSNWIDFDGYRGDEDRNKAEAERQAFKQEFDKARENILSLINKDYATTEKSAGSPG